LPANSIGRKGALNRAKITAVSRGSQVTGEHCGETGGQSHFLLSGLQEWLAGEHWGGLQLASEHRGGGGSKPRKNHVESVYARADAAEGEARRSRKSSMAHW